MDKISFKWKRVQYDINNEPTMTCQVFINGRSLIDIVKQVELPMARANDEEAIAGGYALGGAGGAILAGMSAGMNIISLTSLMQVWY